MNNNLAAGDAWRPILGEYSASLQPHHVEYLEGAGGFSGAEFWRLKTASGVLCLRRWPLGHPSFERLTQTHAVLLHAAARGVDFLPIPINSRDGRSFVENDGRFWELTQWLPGEGDFSRELQPEKLRAALISLARFHAATADYPSPACRAAPSPGIAARCEQLRAWTPSELFRLQAAIQVGRFSNPSATEIVAAFAKLAPSVERELSSARMIEVILQPAIRDVWADHFLFTAGVVTGLVDFGGLNIDSPATDVARLLGSMAGDDAAAWLTGLAAYESIRPLSSAERALLPIFDHSAVALSGMNWLRWIYLDERTFPDSAAVEARLSTIAQRMRTAFGIAPHRRVFS